MKFSQGQIVFIVFFIVVFAAGLAWSYLRDKEDNSRFYKGAWKVLVGMIVVMGILSALLKFSGKI